jgi:hypothetical protein
MTMTAFWDIAPCNPAPPKRRYATITLHEALSQKVVIFILPAVRYWKKNKKIHPHMTGLKLPLLSDLQQKVS